TNCAQDITFSSQYGYTLVTPTPTGNLSSNATYASPNGTSSTNATAMITPAPEIQTLTTYYLAPWQDLTAATAPSDVIRKICQTFANGTEECITEYQIWRTSLVTATATTTATLNISTKTEYLEVVEKTFRTNVLSMFAMSKAALKHMKRGDCIVNSSSVAAYMGNPQLVDYSATKGAIATFTRSLAQQQAPKGIRVNAVAPGIIWTPLQPATKGNPADAMDGIGVGMAPLPRPGMPVEVATAYVFLASPLGSYTTGEVIHVNGGIETQG
ncbi:hypothetical protein B0A55_11502, partial [Friedmanniomyces simplex]